MLGPMLRGVCFDLWGTLIVDPPGLGAKRAEERVERVHDALHTAGWGAPLEAIRDAMQTTVDAFVAVHQENRDIDAEERIALFLRHLDPSLRPERDLGADGHEAVRDAIHDSVIYCLPGLLPGAAEALESLSGHGVRMALVSNTGLSPGTALRTVLDELGIGRYFASHVYSDELRAWKPDGLMFDEAVFGLGVRKEDSFFVGDTPEADILGAQSFGIGGTALVGTKRVEGVQATLTLDGVHQLVDALVERGHLASDP